MLTRRIHQGLAAAVGVVRTVVTCVRMQFCNKMHKMASGAHDLLVSVLEIILYNTTRYKKGRTCAKVILPPGNPRHRSAASSQKAGLQTDPQFA
jgi:hypothetical protein